MHSIFAESQRPHYKEWQRAIVTLGLQTGARVNELVQLHCEDVVREDGVDCIRISDAGERRLKNIASRRTVALVEPSRSMLLQLANERRAAGEARVFLELPKGRDGYGRKASDWFARFRKRLKLGREFDGRKLDFHSLRTTFAKLLQDADVPYNALADLMGHTKPGETQRYAGRMRPGQLAAELAKVRFPGLALLAAPDTGRGRYL